MSKTPLFGAGLQGKSAVISAQSRINLYPEIQPSEDKTRIVFYSTPGSVLFSELGPDPIRGMWSLGGYMYVVQTNIFYRINNAGGSEAFGELSSSNGPVGMADNGLQILIVDGMFGYVYQVDTGEFTRLQGFFPNGATTCTWQDGYLIAELDDSFYLSNLDDAFTWDALDSAQAEATSDQLLRVQANNGQILLCGPYNIELWANTGAADFPYSRLGSGVLEVGLAAKWSMTKYRMGVAFLGQNRMGEVQVFSLEQNNSPQVLSTTEFEYEISSYIRQFGSVVDATALAYRSNGHDFLQVNFPRANKSWLYESASGIWSETQTNGGRHVANMATPYLNRTAVADYSSGKIYLLSDTAYTDNGVPILRRMRSRHLYDHDYQKIAELWVDMETGVGDMSSNGENPQIMLRVSKDGGRTWARERWASMGRQGEYTARALWRRIGRSRDFDFEISITQPNKVAITGEGWVNG